MIQLEQQQHGEFVCGRWWGGWVADTNYLYPDRWGWINIYLKKRFLVNQCPGLSWNIDGYFWDLPGIINGKNKSINGA